MYFVLLGSGRIWSWSAANEAEAGGKCEGAEVCCVRCQAETKRGRNRRRPEGDSAPISSSLNPPCQSQQRRFNESRRRRVVSCAAHPPPHPPTPTPSPSSRLHRPSCRNTIRLRSQQLHFHPDAVLSHRSCCGHPTPHWKGGGAS